MKSKLSKRGKIFLSVWASVVAVLLAAVIVTIALSPPGTLAEIFKRTANDTAVSDSGGSSFLGRVINPALICAYAVTVLILAAAAAVRIFALPKFSYIPGKFQCFIERVTEFFTGIANGIKRIKIHRQKKEKKPRKKLSKRRKVFLAVWALIVVLLFAAVILTIVLSPPGTKAETVQGTMKDAVLHESNRFALFGLEVNPSLISAYIVTGILLIAAAAIRIFALPRFRYVPGKFQSAVEKLVEFFTDMAQSNSPHKPRFLSCYIFSAGVYIFFGTVFELFGVQAVTSKGLTLTLPAPLADINAAIAMGCTSFGVILAAGIINGGIKGALRVLKDFSLPISMSFRLFGALLSGLLVTELVYYYISLSFVLPVIVGVLFTLLHALIQAYVLIMLVSIFYGEAAEPRPKKSKAKKSKRKKSEA